jgi:predicted CxxxxCH...CXXCH cytochrome family protein
VDEAKHMDGEVDVELFSVDATPGSPKLRADPTAAYAGGRCSGTYCHSSGQEVPVRVVTPPWNSTELLGCAACHANPPRHPSGGPGSSTANSHLALSSDGYESGHFGGFPSAWHADTHGAGDGSAAVTCQTCHFDTVDPRNTGPSGFYYLDTTGDYRLAGGLLKYACSDCHVAGGSAPPAPGKVLPLRHVNGARDVTFDRRTTLPPYAALPAAPNTPTRPYWRASAGLGPPFPAGMAYDGTTLSVELSAAEYAPATKTCSNVACHLQQALVQWGAPPTGGAVSCLLCHDFD